MSTTTTPATQTFAILRHSIGKTSDAKDARLPGQCRVCKCTDEMACGTGCGWANKAQTLCSNCTAFAELSRRDIVDVLFAAGYVRTRDLRKVNGSIQEAIEDFNLVIEAVAGDKAFEHMSFALRKWTTPKEVVKGLSKFGLETAMVAEREIIRAA